MLDHTNSVTMVTVTNIVRKLLADHGVDAPIQPNDDLGERGITSTDMVNLMLTVEDEFNIKIPDRAMRPASFRSVSSIDALVRALLSGS